MRLTRSLSGGGVRGSARWAEPKYIGNTVLHHFVLLQNLIEDAQRTAAVDHEIFRR